MLWNSQVGTFLLSEQTVEQNEGQDDARNVGRDSAKNLGEDHDEDDGQDADKNEPSWTGCRIEVMSQSPSHCRCVSMNCVSLTTVQDFFLVSWCQPWL